MKIRTIAAIIALLALTLTACGSESSGKAAPDMTGPAASSSESATTIKASDEAKWPNGVTAKITAVTAGLAAADTVHKYDPEKGDTLVKITIEMMNGGKDVFALPQGGGVGADLFYGENLTTAQSWMNLDSGSSSDLPKQLVPGSSASYTAIWTLPAEGLDSLTLDFTPYPNEQDRYTFTGVEKLLA